MPLSFRHRIFLGLVGLGTLPLAVALVVLALQFRSTGSPVGPRAALDEIAESGRETIAALDTTLLSDEQRAALRAHVDTIASRTNLARRAETLTSAAAGVLGVVILAVALVLVVVSITLARRWSRYSSAPIEELVEWVRRVQRRESLPTDSETRGAPEFDALRHALRDMASELERARRQELEQERLRAFRETARRVAHEMRGPLTASRLAIRQLGKTGIVRSETASPTLDVLEDETRRLEQMAQEFSEFGRLPEGPEATIDVGELIESVVVATVPRDLAVEWQIAEGLEIRGHYEALRRALQNVMRNAVQVTGEEGVHIRAQEEADRIRITISDYGPGVPIDVRDQIFEPYFTAKQSGTGLGLAIVRQTMRAHGGEITVSESASGGAAFVLEFPCHRQLARP